MFIISDDFTCFLLIALMSDSWPPASNPIETAGFKFPKKVWIAINILPRLHVLRTSTDVSSEADYRHHSQAKSEGDLEAEGKTKTVIYVISR